MKDLQKMKWGMNTDVNAVFNLILERALANNLPPEDMLGTLFIFSDMQFDEAVRGNAALGYGGAPAHAETNYKVAQAKFEEHGYNLPKVVFWNLQGEGDDSMPVTQELSTNWLAT